MERLRLALFGGFQAVPPSGPPLTVSTKKAQALLAYCVLPPGQAHRREKLATLLWGETDDDHARNSLRQSLFVLRKALGAKLSSAIRVERDTIAANPLAVDVDVARFERLAAEGSPHALEKAAALYRGDLLDGFVLDQEPFEEWLVQERERLRDLLLEVLARLLRHQRAQGLTEAAIQTARRLLTIDPLLESVHRALMRLLAQTGRRDGALHQYKSCVGLLRRELRVDPEPETRQLYEEIVGGQVGPVKVPEQGTEVASTSSEEGKPPVSEPIGLGPGGQADRQAERESPASVACEVRIAAARRRLERARQTQKSLFERHKKAGGSA